MALVDAEASAALVTECWQALGTTVVVRHRGGAPGEVRAAVKREIDAIDAAASRFRPDSDLSRVNRGGGAPVRVSRLLAEAVQVALRAAEITDGIVDPTLGESLVAAGYDRDWRELHTVPADAPLGPGDRIVLRRRRAVWHHVELTLEPPSVRLPRGVSLDLGATAKALAADRAARAAAESEAEGVLVSLGGDIATCGTAPPGGWAIRVTDDHRAGPDAPGQTISIASGALATSSIATRRWLHDGHPMHHILDPRDGQPAASPWRTVSVAAATCVDANTASTAAIVIGEGAPDWLAEHRLPARLVAVDGTTRVQGGWPS